MAVPTFYSSSALQLLPLTASHSSAMNSFHQSAYSINGEMKETVSLPEEHSPHTI